MWVLRHGPSPPLPWCRTTGKSGDSGILKFLFPHPKTFTHPPIPTLVLPVSACKQDFHSLIIRPFILSTKHRILCPAL